ncbi:MAG: M48 family metalloprotease [Actinomycetes bacterium]
MFDQISANKRRTWLLLVGFGLLIALVTAAVSFLFRLGTIGFAFAVVFAVATSWASYWCSDRLALAAAGARPADGPEYARYHNLVEGLCIAAGIPKPRLFVIDDAAPNAFATGRNPEHAAIAVTTGLLAMMNRVELEGVLAHELSHVKNYDMLVGTIAVTAVGALALLGDIGLRVMLWGGDRDDDSSNNPAAGLIAVAAIVLIALAPLAARLMQFAMSRRREFLADATGVALTRYPPGLASALEKLRDNGTIVQAGSRAMAQLWIESPLDYPQDQEGNRRSWLNRAFDTHPPIEERIEVLRAM